MCRLVLVTYGYHAGVMCCCPADFDACEGETAVCSEGEADHAGRAGLS